MKFIKRFIEEDFLKQLKPNKALLLFGARRVGKTQFLQTILPKLKEEYLLLHGEDQNTINLLEERSQRNYERLLGEKKLLIIDEAQEIPDIGMKMKLLIDTIPEMKVILTGSSVFDLQNKLGEPLVGRKTTFHLYPLSQLEFLKNEDLIETRSKLEERLIFGSYPELEQLASWDEKRGYLIELVNSYLLKDILKFEGIQKSNKIVSLLKLIAFRVGSEISIENIGNELQLSKNTVDKYLDILSKTFITYKLSGFSRNLDNEITKKNKWFFYDNGIRNALINNFNLLNSRDDHGKLWENYLISERLKVQEYKKIYITNYFWRTHNKQEIDWIEEKDGKINAFEFKWNKDKKVKIPPKFKQAYPDSEFTVISPQNYLDFIL